MNPKLNQRVTVTRLSGFSEPFESCPQVAVFSICYCDILGSARVSGAECFSQLRERFLDVFSDSISVAEKDSQSVLRRNTAAFSGSPKPLSRFRSGPPHN